MDVERNTDHIRQARAAYAARRTESRADANPERNNGSPLAVEATLARISEEVTAEAIERRCDEIRRRKAAAPPRL